MAPLFVVFPDAADPLCRAYLGLANLLTHHKPRRHQPHQRPPLAAPRGVFRIDLWPQDQFAHALMLDFG